MTSSEKLIFQWAEKYISLGWSLIPIKPRSKEPLIPWKEFQIRKASSVEIKEWFRKYQDCNFGVVTGNISRLVVVDLDGIKGITNGLELKLISSVTSLTGNGKQLYYKWTEHIDNSASKIAPGVDIRGDGGFVVLPPSVHPNGKHYRWERFVPERLSNLPTGVLNVSDAVSQPLGKEPGWIAKALEEMKIGNIDTTLTSVCGRLRRDGYSQEDCFRLLEPHALTAGATEGHLEEKIRNIWQRYPSKDEMRLHKSSEQSLLLSANDLYGNGFTELSIHSPADDDSFNKFQQHQLSTTSSNNSIFTGFPTLDKYF